MEKLELHQFVDSLTLAKTVAINWLEEVARTGHKGLRHSVALAGGRIARSFCEAAAEHAVLRKNSFAHVHFFWGDERCVPPTDSESNFALAEKHLLKKISVPAGNVHRIHGEEGPVEAAKLAEAELIKFADSKNPSLDIVLLGMGEDGHVASLFPDELQEVRSNPAIYRHVVSPKPPPNRVTLGYSTIAAAKQVWVLASGSGKKEALLESISKTGQTPLAQLIRMRSHTKLFSDIVVV